MIFLLLIGLLLQAPVIDAENVTRLESVLHLDFAALDGLSPGAGIFLVDDDASTVVTFATVEGDSPLSTAVIWDGETGDLRDTLFIGENQLDRALYDGSLIVARHDGADLIDISTGESVRVLRSDVPVLSVWQSTSGAVCGETQETIICSDGRQPLPVLGGDSGDFARIGRIPPPLAVTVDEEGAVSLSSLEENRVINHVTDVGLAVFGAINSSGTHLAWRDPQSTTVSLLNFETGQNQEIAPLDGDYIAQILLSHGADVIFGIDPQSARRQVWAWDVARGEKFDLGQYRACGERQQPDLAELSPDGTALVIGCAAGIDIWRIN
jgi:hypothetical protein